MLGVLGGLLARLLAAGGLGVSGRREGEGGTRIRVQKGAQKKNGQGWFRGQLG